MRVREAEDLGGGASAEVEGLRREIERLRDQLKGKVRRPSRAPPPPRVPRPEAVEVENFDFGKFAGLEGRSLDDLLLEP